MIRTFIAIDLPSEVRNRIASFQADLKKCGADVRWVKPDSIHLTLKFLGETEEGIVDSLAGAVAEKIKSFAGLNLSLDQTGVFPNRNRPRVCWVGLAGDLAKLAEIQKAVDEAASGFGFERDERKFSPHITMGRIKSSRAKDRLIEALDNLQPERPEFKAEELYLIKSDLKPSGATYTKLARLPLEGLKN